MIRKHGWVSFILAVHTICLSHAPIHSPWTQTNTIIYEISWFQVSVTHTLYVATALRPLSDWQFPPIAEVVTRSLIGPCEVAEKSATSLGPCCDQISRSQVFEHLQKPGCDWFGRRQVPARSPTSSRSVPDQSPTNCVKIGAWLSLKLVGDWSATNRGPLRDLTATSWRPVRNLF